MKKGYSTPKLTTHGNVGSITQFYGAKTRTDFLIFTGSPNSTPNVTSEGSIDGKVIPHI